MRPEMANYPTLRVLPLWGFHCNFVTAVGLKKLEWYPYQNVKKCDDMSISVYSRPLWGKKFSGKFQNPPPPQKKIKMNYAKIEFLSIPGVILSPASGGKAPRPHRALPLVPICLYCLNCTKFG